MAALPFEPKAIAQAPVAKPDVLRRPEFREDPRIRLTQLARLHNEAAETATLANLLGRAPQAMAAVTLSALVVAGLSLGAMPPAEVVVWLVLVGAGVIALWRAYARAIEAPFELFALKSFAGDLSAILFYAGFAWGAGAFLALAPQANIAAAALFAGVPCAALALSLRGNSLLFILPAGMMTAAACLVRPVGGFAAAGLVLAAGATIAGISYWIERLFARTPLPAQPALAA
jgi:hypothetical protein